MNPGEQSRGARDILEYTCKATKLSNGSIALHTYVFMAFFDDL